MKFERKERRGDRSRSRIHTHGEVVYPTFEGGMVKVECKSLKTARALKSQGFVSVPEAPVPQAKPKPKAKAKAKAKAKPKAKATD